MTRRVERSRGECGGQEPGNVSISQRANGAIRREYVHYITEEDEDVVLYYDADDRSYYRANGDRFGGFAIDHDGLHSADQVGSSDEDWSLDYEDTDTDDETSDIRGEETSPRTHTFLQAARAGDLAYIQEYFTQPPVISALHVINRDCQQLRAEEAFNRMAHHLPVAWFDEFSGDCFVKTIARKGHVHVLEWFLSLSTRGFMQHILVAVLPHIGYYAMRSRYYGAELMEILLTSEVFTTAMTSRERSLVVPKMFGGAANHRDKVFFDQLLAHGADLADERICAGLINCSYFSASATTRVMSTAIFTLGMNSLLANTPNRECLASSQILIKCGMDVRGYDEGCKPLHSAAQEHYVGSLELFLSVGGANVNVTDRLGRTALMIASSWSAFAASALVFCRPFLVVSLLLRHGADVHLKDRRGRTALHFAVLEVSNVVGLLLQNGADPNARDNTGATPVHLSVRHNRWDKRDARDLQLLLAAGGDPFLEDGGGNTAYQEISNREEGRTFVAGHPELFGPSSIRDPVL